MAEVTGTQTVFEDDSQPTNFAKLRAIPWGLAYDLANTFFIQLTFFGSVFILFLDDLGLDTSQIGLLLSVMPFLGLLSLFITQPVARAGYRKTFLLSMGFRNLFAGGLLLIPLLAGILYPDSLLQYVAIITIGFAVSRAIAMTAFLPWQQEYLPPHMRGRYSGYSSIIVSIAGLVAVAVAGLLLDRLDTVWRYPILFGIGVLFGLSSLYFASHFPGGAPAESNVSLLRIDKKVFTPLRDSRFVRYLMVLGLITLSIGPVFSFLPIFMRERVGLNDGSIVFLSTGSLVGGLLSSYFWGWLADRYGSKPVSITGLLLQGFLPLLWLGMPRGSALSLPFALGISFIQGIVSSGWSIGSGRLLFVSIVSAENRTEYLSQYNAWTGLLSGFGSILGGFLLQSFSDFQGTVFNRGIDSYSVLFGIGFILSLVSTVLLYTLRTHREAGLREFAGLFIHGNPLTALSSVVRFYYAREEADMLAATRQLGLARSPLTVEELLVSLDDPRFYVRFEAIVSITRLGTNERLMHALIDVMQAPDPALAGIAAWALGRVGNEKAFPPLREALRNSKYRSVQAQAARALGSLGDESSIPLLRERLQTHEDIGFQVACASGLGKLGAVEATSDLLRILYDNPYIQGRKEVGLSLARLVEAEGKYIQLSRGFLEDPATVLAQEMENLREAVKKNLLNQKEILASMYDARERFAHEELDAGFHLLVKVINLGSTEEAPSHARKILAECGERIKEFGRSRLEYPILAIVTLERSMK